MLRAGRPLALARRLDRPIFLDQSGGSPGPSVSPPSHYY